MILLFFLLTALLVGVLVPLTEGTWFHASAHAGALVEPADGERDNDKDQCCCYKIIHAMESSLIDHDQVFRLKEFRLSPPSVYSPSVYSPARVILPL
jgi:hypothetical protein